MVIGRKLFQEVNPDCHREEVTLEVSPDCHRDEVIYEKLKGSYFKALVR